MRQVVYLTTIVGVGAACAFPDVDFVGGGGAGSSTSTTTTSSQTADVTSSGSTASGDSGSSSTGVIECDDDEDGYQVEAPGCCETQGQCDCHDDNNAVNPGIMEYKATTYDKADGSGPSYDWNCDGEDEPIYPNGTCAVLEGSASNITCRGNEPSNTPPQRYSSGEMFPCGTQVNVVGCWDSDMLCDQATETLKCR